MADWNLPTETSDYEDVLDLLDAKDFDAASLFLNEPSNHRDGMIKLVRSPVKFQERSSGAWVDKLLDVTGGGTGAATAANARTNLGLGTMAVQNASAVSISGGTLAGDGNGLTNLAAGNFAAGGTFPAINGSNLTNLDASDLASGTVPDARFPSTLPALNGSLLTSLNATALATGTVNHARLGSGGGGSTKFLREDNTWQTVSVAMAASSASGTCGAQADTDLTISPSLSDYTKAVVTYASWTTSTGSGSHPGCTIISNTQVRVMNQDSVQNVAKIYILQGS